MFFHSPLSKIFDRTMKTPIFQEVLVNLYSDLTLCTLWDIFRILSIIVNSDIFSHIVAYFEPCVTLAYSESWHRTQDIFKTLSRHTLEYSWTLAYSWMHIPKPDSYNNINFLLTSSTLTFNLIYFSTNFKKIYMLFDDNDVNFNAWLSLLT